MKLFKIRVRIALSLVIVNGLAFPTWATQPGEAAKLELDTLLDQGGPSALLPSSLTGSPEITAVNRDRYLSPTSFSGSGFSFSNDLSERSSTPSVSSYSEGDPFSPPSYSRRQSVTFSSRGGSRVGSRGSSALPIDEQFDLPSFVTTPRPGLTLGPVPMRLSLGVVSNASPGVGPGPRSIASPSATVCHENRTAPPTPTSLLTLDLSSLRLPQRVQTPVTKKDKEKDYSLTLFSEQENLKRMYLKRHRDPQRSIRIAYHFPNPEHLSAGLLQDGSADYYRAQGLKRELELLEIIKNTDIVGVIELKRTNLRKPKNETLKAEVEYFPEGDLLKVLKAGPFSSRQTLQLAGRLCSTVLSLHRHGIVHRDIKPENIFIDSKSSTRLRAVLGDLELSYLLKEGTTLKEQGIMRYAGSEEYTFPLVNLLSKAGDSDLDLRSISALSSVPMNLAGEIDDSTFFRLDKLSDWYGVKLSLLTAALKDTVATTRLSVLEREFRTKGLNASDNQVRDAFFKKAKTEFIIELDRLTQVALSTVRSQLASEFKEMSAPDVEFLVTQLGRLLSCPHDPYALQDCDQEQEQACTALTVGGLQKLFK